MEAPSRYTRRIAAGRVEQSRATEVVSSAICHLVPTSSSVTSLGVRIYTFGGSICNQAICYHHPAGLQPSQTRQHSSEVSDDTPPLSLTRRTPKLDVYRADSFNLAPTKVQLLHNDQRRSCFSCAGPTASVNRGGGSLSHRSPIHNECTCSCCPCYRRV